MFTPTFKLPWDYIGCGTPRIELQKIHEEWRACLFNFDIDAAIDGFDAETLEQIGDIFHEASNYIKKVGVDDGPCLFEEMSNELQSKEESRSGSVGSECC